MGKKWADAPVYATIVQIRFNAIMTLSEYVPKIQEAMRKQGFSDFQENSRDTIVMNPNHNSPTIKKETQYSFSDMDQTSCFALHLESLSFQTTRYDTSGIFFEIFLSGVKAVHDAVTLDYIDRIGIRYLDAVSPKKDKKLADYLASGVQGLSQEFQDNFKHAFFETSIENDNILTISRVVIEEGKVRFPPDIKSAPLEEKFQKIDELHAIIDTDSFIEKRFKFDLEKIKSQLASIHKQASDTFKKTVTPDAITEWTGK